MQQAAVRERLLLHRGTPQAVSARQLRAGAPRPYCEPVCFSWVHFASDDFIGFPRNLDSVVVSIMTFGSFHPPLPSISFRRIPLGTVFFVAAVPRGGINEDGKFWDGDNFPEASKASPIFGYLGGMVYVVRSTPAASRVFSSLVQIVDTWWGQPPQVPRGASISHIALCVAVV